MFRGITFVSTFFVLGCTGAAIFYLTEKRECDLPFYQSLVEASRELRSKSALEREPARQYRTGVQKDIWTLSNKERLHYRLKSGSSDLTIAQKKGKIDAVEHLKNIECLMQEEIGDEQQQIRGFMAPEGTYTFPAHQFMAGVVDLYFFALDGGDLPPEWPKDNPFLNGTANTVVFSAEGGLSFTADLLNAELEAPQ